MLSNDKLASRQWYSSGFKIDLVIISVCFLKASFSSRHCRTIHFDGSNYGFFVFFLCIPQESISSTSDNRLNKSCSLVVGKLVNFHFCSHVEVPVLYCLEIICFVLTPPPTSPLSCGWVWTTF